MDEEISGKLRKIELQNLQKTFRNSMQFVLLDPAAGEGKDAEQFNSYCSDRSNQIVKIGCRWTKSALNSPREKQDIWITEEFGKVELPKGKFGAVYLHLDGRKAHQLREYLESIAPLFAEEGVLILLTDLDNLTRGEEKNTALELVTANFNKFTVYRTSSGQMMIICVKGKRDTTPAKLVFLCTGARGIPPTRGKYVYDIPYTVPIKTVSVSIDTGITADVAANAISSYAADFDRMELLLPPVFEARRPLMPLRRGHIAQLLASGLVNGRIVHPKTKERFIIKGSSVRVETKEDLEDGSGEKTYSREVVSIKMMDQYGAIVDIT